MGSRCRSHPDGRHARALMGRAGCLFHRAERHSACGFYATLTGFKRSEPEGRADINTWILSPTFAQFQNGSSLGDECNSIDFAHPKHGPETASSCSCAPSWLWPFTSSSVQSYLVHKSSSVPNMLCDWRICAAGAALSRGLARWQAEGR